MKRILLFLAVVGLLVGAASPVLASESLWTIHARESINTYNTQWGMLKWYQIVDPVAADSDGVYSMVEMPVIADSTVTFTSAQSLKFDDVRPLAVYVNDIGADNNNDIDAGTLTINGTNILGATISESFTISDNTPLYDATSTVAFKTITTASLPVMSSTTAVISLGPAPECGLPFSTVIYPVVLCTSEGTHETTWPVGASLDFDEVEKCFVTFNDAPDGSTSYNLLLWVPATQDTDAELIW